MSAHKYSPREALDLLLQKVDSRDRGLAEQLRLAIDAGKDVEEEGAPIGRRKKSRRYRKAVPFTEEEALRVALDVLQAYFVEQALFVSSALDDFRAAAIGEPISQRRSTNASALTHVTADAGQYAEKELEIEPHAETQISRPSDQMVRLTRVDPGSIRQQKRNLEMLHDLIDFNGVA